MRYRDLGEVPRRLPKAGVLVHNWVHAQWEDQRPGRSLLSDYLSFCNTQAESLASCSL